MKLETFVMVALVLAALLATYNALAGPPENAKIETRYCYSLAEIPRDSDGKIHRDHSVIDAFYKAHPCPITKKTTGACAGWEVNHVIPLASGGCDSVSNLQFLPLKIKTANGLLPKDRWERKVYCSPQVLVPMPVE